MSYVNRNMIVPIALVPLCRALVAAATESQEIADGMWVTELAATPEGPATHAISAGATASEMADLLPLLTYITDENGDEIAEVTPGDVYAVAALGDGIEPEQVQALFAAVLVTDEDPWLTLARVGLVIVQPPMPDPV